MKISIFTFKPDFFAELYIFVDNFLEGLYFLSEKDLLNRSFYQKVRGSDKVYVLLDDPYNYFTSLSKFPLLKDSELKKAIGFELISNFGERARYSFETVGIREDESGLSALVLYTGIKESYFSKILEYLRDFKDLIDLVIPYPLAYKDFDTSLGTMILEVYEDRTKMTVLLNGAIVLTRLINLGSGKVSQEEMITRILDEVERISYFVKQNFERNFEFKKIYYFMENKNARIDFRSLGVVSEALELSHYRGGEVVPYLLLQKDPRKFTLNILPPIVSYREVSPYIFLFSLLLFLSYNVLFALTYNRYREYQGVLRNAYDNLRAGINKSVEFIKQNRMDIIVENLNQWDAPLDDLIKMVSANLERGMRLSYFKAENRSEGLNFYLDLDFDNVPEFKKEDLVKAFVERLRNVGSFKNLAYSTVSVEGKKVFRVTGIMERSVR